MTLRKRSQDQERRAAERYEARTTPASGARSIKGDIRSKTLSGEMKMTINAKSISLKLADLQKIRREATGDQMPFLELEFQGVHPHERYVVLRETDYLGLLRTEKAYREINQDD